MTQNFRKLRFNSIDSIRTIYRRATKSFLLNHHHQVWSSILIGLETIDQLLLPLPTNSPWWLNHSSSIDSTLDQELLQLDRKFQILKITFLTSIIQSAHSHHSNFFLNQSTQQLTPQQHLQLQEFYQLNDQPHLFLIKLLSSSSSQHQLYQIHPSILTAIGLASIKLSVPQTGKELIENWFTAIQPFQLNFTNHHTLSSPDRTPTTDLKLSYQNLIQIYSIHILGTLNQWQFAIDFIQSHLSAQILPQETVDNILEALQVARIQQNQLIKHNVQRHLQQQQQQQQQRRSEEKNRQTKTGHNSSRAKYSSGSSTTMSTTTTATSNEIVPSSPTIPICSRRTSLTSPTFSGTPGYIGFRSHLNRFINHPSSSHHHINQLTLSPKPSSSNSTPHPILPRLKLFLSSLLLSISPNHHHHLKLLGPPTLILSSILLLKPLLFLKLFSPLLSKNISSSLKSLLRKLFKLLQILFTQLP